jgi:hypothetical protein
MMTTMIGLTVLVMSGHRLVRESPVTTIQMERAFRCSRVLCATRFLQRRGRNGPQSRRDILSFLNVIFL